MSKDVLEAALQKTRDLEEKEKKRMKLAETFGRIAGALVAWVIDATFVWAVVNFMIGASFTWLASAGVIALLWMVSLKFNK